MKRMENALITLLVFAAMAYVWQTFNEASTVPEYEGPVQQVVVTDGDSVWKLADTFSIHSSLTIEESVDWIVHHNELNGSTVLPGQAVNVPVGVTEVAME